jgi:hypothetical protein
LHLNHAQGDVVLVNSDQQLLALDKRTGTLKWKTLGGRSDPGGLIVHPDGVWRSSTNFALATGEPISTFSNFAFGQTTIAGGRLAQLSARNRNLPEVDEPAELTAGSIHNVDIKSIVSQAQGKKIKPQERVMEHRLQIISLTDGRLLVEKILTVPYGTRLLPAGDNIAVVTATAIQIFRDQPEPIWTANLPGAPEHLAAGGDLLLVLTAEGVLAFDAKSGAEKWKRTDLNGTHARTGPDGGVYVTVAMSKAQFNSGAAEKFRMADVRRGLIGPPSRYRALLRLDPQTGQTRWGVRNIGEELLFDGDKLFVIDRVHDMNLLANQIMVGSYSVRQISPKSGKDVWMFLKAGDLYHCTTVHGVVVAVTAADPPSGRTNPSCPYELVVIAGQ